MKERNREGQGSNLQPSNTRRYLTNSCVTRKDADSNPACREDFRSLSYK